MLINEVALIEFKDASGTSVYANPDHIIAVVIPSPIMSKDNDGVCKIIMFGVISPVPESEARRIADLLKRDPHAGSPSNSSPTSRLS